MNVILYTTECPKCKVLEAKLQLKDIEYEKVDDIDIMNKKGFMEAPMLEVDGQVMNFEDANTWINGR